VGGSNKEARIKLVIIIILAVGVARQPATFQKMNYCTNVAPLLEIFIIEMLCTYALRSTLGPV
jgi:hypothetical protein